MKRLRASLRRRPGLPPEPPDGLGTECRRGVAIGSVNGVLLAAAAGASAPLALLAACGGGAVGALIGVLLWSASDAVRDDPVRPPKPR